MGRIIYTENIGYNLRTWRCEPIKRVFAGTGCIMALTSDGKALKEPEPPFFNAKPPQYVWQEYIQDISISKWSVGMAIGLTIDGTCVIAEQPQRRISQDYGRFSFATIRDQVKSWSNIVQVAVSDTYFALDCNGNVHMAAIDSRTKDDYSEVTCWSNVGRLVTGTQSSVFGITNDGRLLCAGCALQRGPHGDIGHILSSKRDVMDVFPTGGECQKLLIAYRDGTVEDLEGNILPIKVANIQKTNDGKVFDGHFWYEVYILSSDHRLFKYVFSSLTPAFEDNPIITSFAVGDHDYQPPFVIATT